MPTLHDLSTFDLVILCMILALCIRGLWIGCLRQLPGLLALVGGYLLVGRVMHVLLPWTSSFITSPKVSFLIGFALLSLVGWFILSCLVKLMGRVQRKQRIGVGARFFGLILGGCTAVTVTSLLYMVLASTLSTTNNLLRTSQTSPFLRQSSEMLRSLIADPLLCQSFLHKEPAIAPQSPATKQEAIQPDPQSNKP